MKAVSISEYKKYGCINCGCDFAYNNCGVRCYGTIPVKCGECGSEFVILSDDLTVSKIGFGTGKKDSNDEEIIEYPKLISHPRTGIMKHGFIREDVRPKTGDGEFCRPRGVGYDLSCFVRSKEAGERVVRMFNNIRTKEEENNFSCYLDYRPTEPLWIQIKIGYDEIGEKNASALAQLIALDGIITVEKILEARDIVWNFENTWQFITKNKIWNCINIPLMKDLIKYPSEIKEYDEKLNGWDLKTKNNQLAMFEIYGMYLQVERELQNGNIDVAFSIVKHVVESLETKLFRDINSTSEKMLHQHLLDDLIELINAYKAYDKKEPSVVKKIKG